MKVISLQSIRRDLSTMNLYLYRFPGAPGNMAPGNLPLLTLFSAFEASTTRDRFVTCYVHPEPSIPGQSQPHPRRLKSQSHYDSPVDGSCDAEADQRYGYADRQKMLLFAKLQPRMRSKSRW